MQIRRGHSSAAFGAPFGRPGFGGPRRAIRYAIDAPAPFGITGATFSARTINLTVGPTVFSPPVVTKNWSLIERNLRYRIWKKKNERRQIIAPKVPTHFEARPTNIIPVITWRAITRVQRFSKRKLDAPGYRRSPWRTRVSRSNTTVSNLWRTEIPLSVYVGTENVYWLRRTALLLRRLRIARPLPIYIYIFYRKRYGRTTDATSSGFRPIAGTIVDAKRTRRICNGTGRFTVHHDTGVQTPAVRRSIRGYFSSATRSGPSPVRTRSPSTTCHQSRRISYQAGTRVLRLLFMSTCCYENTI